MEWDAKTSLLLISLSYCNWVETISFEQCNFPIIMYDGCYLLMFQCMHRLWCYVPFRPQTIPPSWFGGVTDWYQSIVYSELSISIHLRYTTINTMGLKLSKTICTKCTLKYNDIFIKYKYKYIHTRTVS